MTTFTSEDRMTAQQDLSQEQSYLLAVKVIKQQLIVWPESADSKLWNDRVNGLLKNLTIEFGFDGENE
ncbi:MAG TPA: hypothetical protein PL192_06855 [Polynucleobacter sp.]|jgi:tRNA(Glu) U13 pseudouridine synthase TruD|nr:hypothetical protein [Polynucleobacter sp.]